MLYFAVILLTNLVQSVTEAKILEFIVNLTALPIKSIKFQTDSFSGQKSCSIELHSVQEAEQLHQTLSSQTSVLTIDDSPIAFSYGSKFVDNRFNNRNHASQYVNANVIQGNVDAGANQAALAALAAAQWNNLGSSNDSNNSAKQTPLVEGKMPAPNYAAFQFDVTSGFYYDSTTGYYFDSSSQYFYNSVSFFICSRFREFSYQFLLQSTQKYMYYDSTSETYVPVDSTVPPTPSTTVTNDNSSSILSTSSAALTPSVAATAAAAVTTPIAPPAPPNPLSFMPPIATPVSQAKKEDGDKTMSAKKLAKEMEKWAKNQNQKVQRSVSRPIQPIAGFDNFDEDESGVENVSSQISVPETSISSPQMDPFELIMEKEAELVDEKMMTCFLCKRQFKTIIQLQKHQELSELHKVSTKRICLFSQ